MPPNDSDLTEPSIETLRAENRSLRDRLEMSSRLYSRVASSLSPDEVLREIIDAARELTSAKFGALAVSDGKGGVRQFFTTGIDEAGHDAIGKPPSSDDGLFHWLSDLREPIRLADLTVHPKFRGFPKNHPGMTSFLGVPLRLHDQPLGNLYLTEKPSGGEFTVEDEHTLTMFAQHAASAIRNARQVASEHRALSDARAAQEAHIASENLLQSIMDNTPAVVFVKDSAGRYISVNRRFESLYHISREEAVGKTDYDLHTDQVAAAIRANDERVLAADGPLEFEEVVPSDDVPHTYLAVRFPLKDADGNTYAVCGISTDITQRVEAEQLKSDFLSMASHDLRGLLATIKGLASSLLLEPEPCEHEFLEEYLVTIDEETDRMAELVGNLLDMSRIEARSMPLDPETCHLADISAETVRNIERSRAGGRHNVRVDIPLDLPEIYADYEKIGRVLANLLSNAIKYSPPGSHVEIRSRLESNGQDIIRTWVRDEGIGIPEEDAPKIFTNSIGCRAISVVGGPVRDWAWLSAKPKSKLTAEDSGWRALQAGVQRSTSLCLFRRIVQPMTRAASEQSVLVVDDDPKFLAFVARRLRQEGYVVETALNGRDALDKAAGEPPNLVLLDLSMPVLGGIETLGRLREWYDEPIIILSATDEESQKVEALDLGADDYLTKPFGLEEMVARVRTALRRVDRMAQATTSNAQVITAGDLQVNLGHRTVTRAGEEVSLTRTEYELLRCLVTNKGKVMTHLELLREVWGPEYGEETEYLRTFVKQLRRKLEADPSRPTHLLTQPGRGYRFTE